MSSSADPRLAALPLRYEAEVPPSGRIELDVPLPVGSHVTIYIVKQPASDLDDLLRASITSTAFWDNPEDDEDWNDA
jgi:hypothetical protein